MTKSLTDADRQEADADLISAQHKKLCRGCPWDGKTIFSEASPASPVEPVPQLEGK